MRVGTPFYPGNENQNILESYFNYTTHDKCDVYLNPLQSNITGAQSDSSLK